MLYHENRVNFVNKLVNYNGLDVTFKFNDKSLLRRKTIMSENCFILTF